jgi:hypothetical protein
MLRQVLVQVLVVLVLVVVVVGDAFCSRLF